MDGIMMMMMMMMMMVMVIKNLSFQTSDSRFIPLRA